MSGSDDRKKPAVTVGAFKAHLSRKYRDTQQVHPNEAHQIAHGKAGGEAVRLDVAIQHIEAEATGSPIEPLVRKWEGRVRYYASDSVLLSTQSHLVYGADQNEALREVHKTAASIIAMDKDSTNGPMIPVDRYELVGPPKPW